MPAISIRGHIVPGDERTFAAVAAKREASVVYLSSEGGEVDAAIAIGRMVRKFGLDTFVGRGSIGCWSACTLIWLSGRLPSFNVIPISAFMPPTCLKERR